MLNNTEINPADAATLRTSPCSLVKNLLSWDGPSFLEGDEDRWLKAKCTKYSVVVDLVVMRK